MVAVIKTTQPEVNYLSIFIQQSEWQSGILLSTISSFGSIPADTVGLIINRVDDLSGAFCDIMLETGQLLNQWPIDDMDFFFNRLGKVALPYSYNSTKQIIADFHQARFSLFFQKAKRLLI